MLHKRLLLSSMVILVLFSFHLVSSVAASSEMWNQVYGGAGADFAHSVVEASDGGYAVVGCTSSSGAGGTDVLLIKIDEHGTMEWNRTYGGVGGDFAYSVVAASDGGFAVAGVTDSFGAGGNDFWLIKTDSVGSMEWNQTYGDTNSSIAYSLVETSDGGYALAGSSGSPSHFPIGSGTTDFWLVKTDAYGNMEWNQTYGGTGDEVAYSLIETSDRGFALAGEQSNNFWLVKTDEYGSMKWNQTYGEAKYDHAYSVVEPSDGGFVLASTNFRLIKTDAHGTVEWNWTYGREDYDTVYSLVAASDGGFALAGETSSFDYGNGFWLVKTDASGNMEWNQAYRRTEYDRPYSLIQASDGGYVLAGETINLGSTCVWVVKTDGLGDVPEFPSWTPLLIALIAVMAVAIVYRRSLKTQNQKRINS
jgi:hypothetical protein